MPLIQNVLFCALVALVLSAWVGLPLTRWLVSDRATASAMAPIVGWAVFSALALPILTFMGFTRVTVGVLSGVAILLSAAALLWSPSSGSAPRADGASISIGAYAAAALVAVVPALSTWPKVGGDGMVLAESMFDHSKVALIADMARLGLPPGNPFFGEVGVSPMLAYYYLWHFGAATFSLLAGASGWEADIALTWFTAYASLTLMMGLAVWLSGQSLAAFLVVMLSLAASLRPLLSLALTPDFIGRALSQDQPAHSWIFQASWVPQHLASASCVVLAMLILSRLASPRSWLLVPLLAVIVAASFESSAWVGGVIFAVSAVLVGVFSLLTADDARSRVDFLAKATAAAILVVAISFPLLRDEYAATAARDVGVPIAFQPFEVLGPIVPNGIRRILDLPAYWAILMVIEFPAIYFAGTAAVIGALAGRGMARTERRVLAGFALLCSASFGIAWLFVSTIANNDLGWRGTLPGILILTVFAAAGLSRWLATAPAIAIAAIACFALGVPDGLRIVEQNAVGTPMPSAAVLAQSPELWAAVRGHSAPDERVGNNPLFLADSVRWPVNISWALFANRRSCYAGWDLVRAYVALPQAETDRINALFERVFAGDGSPQDIRELATRYDCRVIVLSASDAAWGRDPFANSGYYQLVEQNDGKWRIYRSIEASRGAQ
jgi:hypothetical protein